MEDAALVAQRQQLKTLYWAMSGSRELYLVENTALCLPQRELHRLNYSCGSGLWALGW